LTGSVGVIGLDFVWKGFAKLVDGKLEVGDVFIGGLVLLDGELLRFVFPEHLSVAEVSPKPDTIGARFVGWAGRKVFQDGEPRIVLAPSIPTQQGPLTGPSSSLERSPQFLDPWVLAAFGAAAAVIAIGAVALTRGKNKRSTAYASDDVGKVLEVIRRHGGAVTQSKIVKESGLSKSTVSTILKVLERERVVVRQKAGREKLVRLAR
jgi:DNA-binding transcriptional ArsR family regulator